MATPSINLIIEQDEDFSVSFAIGLGRTDEEMTALAESCNLPKEFVNIFAA